MRGWRPWVHVGAALAVLGAVAAALASMGRAWWCRAGDTGLWAGDVFRMLTRYAERRGFKWERLGANPGEAGGFNEVTFAVKGDGTPTK